MAKLKTLWNELNNGLQSKAETKLPHMLLICKIFICCPVNISRLNPVGCCLLMRNKLFMQLCSFERDMKSSDVHQGSKNQEALAVKAMKSQYQSQRTKFVKTKVKGLWNYCHEPGHWVKNCSKWIADGKPKRNSVTNDTHQNSATNVFFDCLCGSYDSRN